jgi:regulator of cell morphogenesis and NO signaling
MQEFEMKTTEQTVREIALANPAFIRVFEKFGIDYCCGGRKPLNEACAAKGLNVVEVEAALDAAEDAAPATDVNWRLEPLAKLAEHIVAKHHAYVRTELPRLEMLAEKVVRRHGDTQPHLGELQRLVGEISTEMAQHMVKEEVVLFPYIAKLEYAHVAGNPAPKSCFNSVESPIAVMTEEHEHTGAALAQIRELTDGFTPPLGACPTYLAYYRALLEFEQDMHQHVHFENNVLFPRAIELEKRALVPAGA